MHCECARDKKKTSQKTARARKSFNKNFTLYDKRKKRKKKFFVAHPPVGSKSRELLQELHIEGLSSLVKKKAFARAPTKPISPTIGFCAIRRDSASAVYMMPMLFFRGAKLTAKGVINLRGAVYYLKNIPRKFFFSYCAKKKLYTLVVIYFQIVIFFFIIGVLRATGLINLVCKQSAINSPSSYIQRRNCAINFVLVRKMRQ